MELIVDKEKIPSLKGVALKDQLKLFKNAGAPNLQKGALPTKVDNICKILIDAMDLHTNGTWKLVSDEESETGNTDLSEEENENEEDWEDMK